MSDSRDGRAFAVDLAVARVVVARREARSCYGVIWSTRCSRERTECDVHQKREELHWRRRPPLFLGSSAPQRAPGSRDLRSSSRSAELSPSALPSSTSSWTDQLRNDCGDKPTRELRDRTTTAPEQPHSLRTELQRIKRDLWHQQTSEPSRPSELSQQMSTQARELHTAPALGASQLPEGDFPARSVVRPSTLARIDLGLLDP